MLTIGAVRIVVDERLQEVRRGATRDRSRRPIQERVHALRFQDGRVVDIELLDSRTRSHLGVATLVVVVADLLPTPVVRAIGDRDGITSGRKARAERAAIAGGRRAIVREVKAWRELKIVAIRSPR